MGVDRGRGVFFFCRTSGVGEEELESSELVLEGGQMFFPLVADILKRLEEGAA